MADKENKVAMEKEFQRCADSNEFLDSTESWQAFMAGWYGTRAYTAERRAKQEEGSGWFMLGSMLFIFGSVLLGTMLMFYFFIPPINVVRAIYIGAIGLIMMALSIPAVKKARRVGLETNKKFNERWGSE